MRKITGAVRIDNAHAHLHDKEKSRNEKIFNKYKTLQDFKEVRSSVESSTHTNKLLCVSGKMNTNRITQHYPCDEYLKSDFSKGYFDEKAHLQLILPIAEASVSIPGAHLVIGHPGCDGIEFCYQKSKPGIWAFYPQEREYQLKAKNIKELVAGWVNGTISV